MPTVRANGIHIAYDTFGDRSSPPLLLIMGFSGQMILWHEDFCRQLAERNLYVIRFDNRDVGLSSKLDVRDAPPFIEFFEALWRGEERETLYTLDDMADDAIGLLDALGLVKAHVCGTSMGGMIAQVMAIQHPDRVLSLISISSTTGNPDLLSPFSVPMSPPAIPALTPPPDREANIEYTVNGMRELAGPGFPFDEESARSVAAEAYDRSFYPKGAERQLLAVMVSGNRKPALAKLTVPALVIHGDSDPLVPVQWGRDTAGAVPGAKLLIIEGMGHDLPRGAWPCIVDAISTHINGAGGSKNVHSCHVLDTM